MSQEGSPGQIKVEIFEKSFGDSSKKKNLKQSYELAFFVGRDFKVSSLLQLIKTYSIDNPGFFDKVVEKGDFSWRLKENSIEAQLTVEQLMTKSDKNVLRLEYTPIIRKRSSSCSFRDFVKSIPGLRNLA